MCGRYNFTVEQSDEIREILKKLNAKIQKKEPKLGEIFPTNLVPVLQGKGHRVEVDLISWGFPKWGQKGVIINSRSETAFEKSMFRESLINRRCIIPSTGFYEWDREKSKFLFQMEGTSALYMAGIYKHYGEEGRFVILTTEANDSMKEVHNRMPLVIPRDEIDRWILDSSATNEMLHRVPPRLVRTEA